MQYKFGNKIGKGGEIEKNLRGGKKDKIKCLGVQVNHASFLVTAIPFVAYDTDTKVSLLVVLYL